MIKHLLIIGVAFTLGLVPASAQILNKIKQKASQKAENALEKKLGLGDDKNTNNPGDPGAPGNNPGNKTGGGLITTPPDVMQNIADAQSSYKSSKYGEARYAVQQAMLGVEMEIGNKILNSLPESISGLKKDASADQVTSTGFGWVGLTIQREYNDNDDKEFRIMVANNSMMMSAVNMYLSSGGYSQTTGGEQNWKQTKLKGHRAIIEYNEGSGYKLSVPLGQSSLIVFEGVNFASEPDMMKAAEAVDVDGIKATLGEQ
ncbi:MAG TPA: hypothetical protein PK185_08290 [Cyclobacteriaceae bacterium]|jgi:hypothetical protein|nr:hypothetical protein [Cyclobacteriaceae bacterium]